MDNIVDINQLDLNRVYSYADYLMWDLRQRVELIKGKIFKMSPAPSEEHQKISMKIIQSLLKLLDKKACNLYHAPFDVRLPINQSKEESQIHTVVQPDIVIICDQSKIDEKGCLGPPDLVFEIVSKSSAKRDLHEKYDLYESSGVKEYWIVNPLSQTIQVNTLNTDGKYVPGRQLTRGDSARSNAFEGLELDINSIFPLILEEPEGEYGPNYKRL